MLLEIHLKLIELQNEIKEKANITIDTNLQNSSGTLQVRRGKIVLKEKSKFDFLKYLIHYEGLDDHYKEMLD